MMMMVVVDVCMDKEGFEGGSRYQDRENGGIRVCVRLIAQNRKGENQGISSSQE